MPVDASLLDAQLKKIRARRGADAVHWGNEQTPVDRIPLPSPALMRITSALDGSAGIPMGRITRLWGSPSAGKSIMLWMIFKAAQDLRVPRFPEGLGVCLWNVEKQYDPFFVAQRGVDVSKLLLQQNTIIEEIETEIDSLLSSVHVHGIDSCSYATSVHELAGEPADQPRAIQARAWKKTLHRINTKLDKDENAVIALDHAAQDMTSKAEYAMGGRAMEHASSLSLHFRKGSWLYYHPDGFLDTKDNFVKDAGYSPSGQKEADGIEIVVRCAKSRVCRPFRVARLRLDLNTFSFDTAFELFDAGMFFDEDGVPAHRSGKDALIFPTGDRSSWYHVHGYEKAANGQRAVRAILESDQGLREIIEKAMLSGW